MNLKDITLYEDDDVIAINKPAGLMVHPDGKPSRSEISAEETLSDIVLREHPDMANVGEPMGDIVRPGIVHRLDRDTSGVMLIAKNQKSFEFLKKQFQDRTIHKTYRAIVEGHFKEPSGTIDMQIGRSKNDFRKWLAGRGTRGTLRDAVTHYSVLQEFTYDGNVYSYIEVQPKTGRTHQIRVHMKAISHPIVGDALYGSSKANSLGFSRQALHAFSIDFQLPSGTPLHLEAAVPGDMGRVLTK